MAAETCDRGLQQLCGSTTENSAGFQCTGSEWPRIGARKLLELGCPTWKKWSGVNRPTGICDPGRSLTRSTLVKQTAKSSYCCLHTPRRFSFCCTTRFSLHNRYYPSFLVLSHCRSRYDADAFVAPDTSGSPALVLTIITHTTCNALLATGLHTTTEKDGSCSQTDPVGRRHHLGPRPRPLQARGEFNFAIKTASEQDADPP